MKVKGEKLFENGISIYGEVEGRVSEKTKDIRTSLGACLLYTSSFPWWTSNDLGSPSWATISFSFTAFAEVSALSSEHAEKSIVQLNNCLLYTSSKKSIKNPLFFIK